MQAAKINQPNPDPSVVGDDLAFQIQLTPQARIVWQYLKGGRHLTQLIALGNMGIGSITSRISEIRRKATSAGRPETILDAFKKDHAGKRYKSWWMDPQFVEAKAA